MWLPSEWNDFVDHYSKSPLVLKSPFSRSTSYLALSPEVTAQHTRVFCHDSYFEVRRFKSLQSETLNTKFPQILNIYSFFVVILTCLYKMG